MSAAPLARTLVLALVLASSWGGVSFAQSWFEKLLGGRASRPLTVDEERALGPKDSFAECKVCPEMIVVPPGQFMMGSLMVEPGRQASEGPQHQVAFSQPFAIGKFEVTVGQFAAFVDETGHGPLGGCTSTEDVKDDRTFRDPGFRQTDAHPAVCVSWHDAKAYVAWLSRKTGKVYRLPTEAEWEYAARGRTTGRYHFGEDEKQICRHENGADIKLREALASSKYGPGPASGYADCSDGYAYTAPVGSFPANPFGLYDMLGNVGEWVEDCWHSSYVDAPSDGSAWIAAAVLGLPVRACDTRTLRGGSWAAGPADLRSAYRPFNIHPKTAVLGTDPSWRVQNLGFRVVRSLGQ